jgi:hypothetical protein
MAPHNAPLLAHVAELVLLSGGFAEAEALFKRALVILNGLLAEMQAPALAAGRAAAWREMALPRVFDLREIWLRVIAECRDEVERLGDDE